MRVLNIDVPADLVGAWRAWLAPEWQPFVTTEPLTAGKSRDASPEERDSFQLWKVDKAVPRVWLREAEFGALPRATRARLVREQITRGRGGVPSVRAWSDVLDPRTLRAQADGHRFVWWPSLLPDEHVEAALTRVVAHDGLESRHHQVPVAVWERCATVVPDARRLVGAFPDGSGPNCFGTVMGACGVDGAANEWVLPPSFEDWLSRTACLGGSDDDAGTVLVWRDREGGAQHAAVTIGDGWAIEKPSQEWWTPRWVLRVRELIASRRQPGLRLMRYSPPTR